MNKYILFFAILITSRLAVCQSNEFGVHAGVMNYIGDISPGIITKDFHPTFGAFYKYNHNRFFLSRFSYNYGSISASDATLTYNRIRNLSFTSVIHELSYLTEFNFQPHGGDKFSDRFTLFVAAGLAGFYFEPYAIYDRVSYKLRDYGTEGQFLRHSSTYTNVDWAIPFGGGFKIHLDPHWVLSIETIWRKTTTDHLDDVGNGNYMQDANGKYIYTGYPDAWDMNKFNDLNKDMKPISLALSDRSGEVNKEGNMSFKGKQRGNPYNKDWYYTFGLSLSYKIIKTKCGGGSF